MLRGALRLALPVAYPLFSSVGTVTSRSSQQAWDFSCAVVVPVLLFAFLYLTQASTCRADVSQVGASPLGLRLPPIPADQSVHLQEGPFP